MRQRIVIMGGMLLLLAACGVSAGNRAPQPEPQPAGTAGEWRWLAITGVVREEETGRPIAGIIVQVQEGPVKRGTLTDSAGRYRLAGLGEGHYTIVARRTGYYSEQRTISHVHPSICVGECPPPGPVERSLNFYMRPSFICI